MANGDLTEVPTDELIRLARQVTAKRRRQDETLEQTVQEQGQVYAALVERPGWSYAKVAELVGIDDSTLHRIVRRALDR